MSFSFNIFSPSFNLFSLSPSIKNPDYEGYHKEILYKLKEAMCYNQGAIAQYEYIASKRHMEMKKESKTKKRVEKLTEHCEALEKHLYEEMIKAFDKNFAYIKKYFEGCRKTNPRICVKLYGKNNQTDEKEIVDFYRDEQSYKSPNYLIDKNTGFKRVHTSGKWYFCNNIPKDVRKDNYENPRLDNSKANRYKLSLYEMYRINKIEEPDENWIKCWNGIEDQEGINRRPTAEECYKSTMIIPMTLRGNDLYPEFREDFEIDPNDERAIYGYLCVDHHTINYFEEEPDRFVGYMFADIMSLYKIAELKLTRFSGTYRKVKEMIEG